MSLSTEPDALFETLDKVLETNQPGEAIDHLATLLAERGEFRALLDARLLKARLDLGLPLVQTGSLAEIPEPARTQYEDATSRPSARSVTACSKPERSARPGPTSGRSPRRNPSPGPSRPINRSKTTSGSAR